MEIRVLHILLIRAGIVLVLTLGSAFAMSAEKKKGLNVNSELFDIGVVAGVITLEDFPSEFALGASLTFKASEDFFLQYNYIQSDVSLSSIEAVGGEFGLTDRSFTHYDLLLGYNIFQGEFFRSGGSANLSNVYVIGGFGDTNFGGEENFTYTVGVGYLVEFSRKYLMRVDFRDYIFESSLIVSEAEELVHNTQFSIGLGYLF